MSVADVSGSETASSAAGPAPGPAGAHVQRLEAAPDPAIPPGLAPPPDALALTLADYERLARAVVRPAVWDFIEGGAGRETSLAANRAAFDRVRFHPRVLAGPGTADPAVTVFGERWAAPLGVAPMAFHTMVHPDGEVATVRAAGAAGLPAIVSTLAGRGFEELAATGGSWWLQVYVFRDRGVTRALIERAQEAGAGALMLTVDAPHLGRRLRDMRNGFELPPHVVPANLPGTRVADPGAHARAELDPFLGWDAVDWLRSVSPLPVLVKGILTAADARRALAAGVDGIAVSNHGGRQLDAVPASFDALPAIAEAVAGRCPVLVDGGIRGGGDVLACLAAGATAALLGRPVLHGLAVAGAEGVAGVLRIVLDELADAMALAGVRSRADLGPELLGGVFNRGGRAVERP